MKFESELLEKAYGYASQAHEGQFYGKHEYIKHLIDVYNVAKEFDLDEDIQAACFLHDTIEDCKLKYRTVKNEFGQKIVEIVWGVTNEMGRNAKEISKKTYPKTRNNGDAVLVKLCDRIANLRCSLEDNNKTLLRKYLNDHEDFSLLLNYGYFQEEPLWSEYDEIIKRVYQKEEPKDYFSEFEGTKLFPKRD